MRWHTLDKTVYPVSSRNQKALSTTWWVCILRCVFHPNFKQDPQIFNARRMALSLRKRRWWIDLQLSVVQRNACGRSHKRTLELYRLFEPFNVIPDTVWPNIFSGMPAVTPSLTQEESSYVPWQVPLPGQCACDALYGNLDLDTAFAHQPSNSGCALKLKTTYSNLEQAPFSTSWIEAKFSISKDEPYRKQTLMYIWLGKGTNSEELIALGVLDELLLGLPRLRLRKLSVSLTDVSGDLVQIVFTTLETS